MSDTPSRERTSAGQDEQLADVVNRERSRLRSFIRRRVSDPRDVEDVLQDVFSALVEANRLLMPIDHITGWLYRVARNRITDLFRGRGLRSHSNSRTCCRRPTRVLRRIRRHRAARGARAGDPRAAAGAARGVRRSRTGRTSFKMAAATGVGVNTLLSRKRYAVLRLRERLRYLRRSEEGLRTLHEHQTLQEVDDIVPAAIVMAPL